MRVVLRYLRGEVECGWEYCNGGMILCVRGGEMGVGLNR